MNRALINSILVIWMTPLGIDFQKRVPTPKEQTSFALEQPVNSPVPIPEDVLKLLRQDSDLRACDSVGSGEAVPAAWYEASQIHLDGKDEADMVVKATNACLWGPNIGPFWVFRRTPEGYKLVLTTVAVALKVLATKTNGLRNIEAGAIVGLKPQYVTYTFDGKRYRTAK